MNYLIYGADTYRSRKKLNDIIGEYRRKNGNAFNLHRFDADVHDLAALGAIIGGGSLFAAKKLVVVERPLTAPRQFEILRAALAASRQDAATLLVVWDEALEGDAKKRLADVSGYFDKIQESAPLRGAALARWVREEAARRGLNLSPSEVAAFASAGRGDLWAIGNELEKTAVSRGNTGPAGARRGSVIFDLGDTFFSAPREALGHLFALSAQGEDEMGIFAYLAKHARILLAVKSCLDAGLPAAGPPGTHPVVIKKATAAVRGLSLEALLRNLADFLKEDVRIKTGVSRAKDSLLRMLARS